MNPSITKVYALITYDEYQSHDTRITVYLTEDLAIKALKELFEEYSDMASDFEEDQQANSDYTWDYTSFYRTDDSWVIAEVKELEVKM
jgi:hypothetical protein